MLSKTFEQIKYPEPGQIYKHYKGGLYSVDTMATHSETNEPMVVYTSLLFGSTHGRSLISWNEKVKIGKKSISRFSKVKSKRK